MIETHIQSKNFIFLDFIVNEGIEIKELLDACRRISDIEEISLYSLDYVLASSEYQDFYNLIIEHKVYNQLIQNILNYEFDN